MGNAILGSWRYNFQPSTLTLSATIHIVTDGRTDGQMDRDDNYDDNTNRDWLKNLLVKEEVARIVPVF